MPSQPVYRILIGIHVSHVELIFYLEFAQHLIDASHITPVDRKVAVLHQHSLCNEPRINGNRIRRQIFAAKRTWKVFRYVLSGGWAIDFSVLVK